MRTSHYFCFRFYHNLFSVQIFCKLTNLHLAIKFTGKINFTLISHPGFSKLFLFVRIFAFTKVTKFTNI